MGQLSLRDEVLNLSHQWWQIMVSLLVGGLLGWGAAYIWPSPYRATTQIYVGLDAYRSYADRDFTAYANQPYTNLDDYKNWQMSQLDEIIYLDDILRATLAALQEQSAGWEHVTVSELRKILQAEWRSAGKWSLVAESFNSKQAVQASRVWSQVVVKRIGEAIQSAQDMLRLDIQMQAITQNQVQMDMRDEELKKMKASLPGMRQTIAGMQAGQALEPLQRWRVLSLITRLADFSPSWVALLAVQPGPDALPRAYPGWLDQASAMVDSELPVLQGQLDGLEQERVGLLVEYTRQSKSSLGVSPNLVIEELSDAPTEVSIPRPTGLVTLVGGVLGLLAWVMTRLVQISRRAGNKVQ
jgi:hypothetical protein